MTIAFFGTGGTIANRGTGPENYLDYLDHGTVMEADELIAAHPELREIAEIRVEPFGALRSKYITAAHWAELAHRLTHVLAQPEIAGAVVAHGTGTLEETAWFLHLVVKSAKPIVMVGAQRPGSTTGSDVQRNLADAFRIAAHRDSHARGVTVVMNREIHSARDVTKVANHRLDALQSPVRGPLGVLGADHRVQYWRSPTTPHTQQSRFAELTTPLPRVDIVHAYTGADATAVEAFINAGARGLVAVGYPPGTLTRPMDDAVDAAVAQGIQVVQASRGVFEPAVTPRSGLISRGLIPNTDITAAKAKVLLQLCLAQGLTPEQSTEVVATY
ncbi:asparaginase [Enteractinococcus fodinae]|uniref:L-asparaginase n=1 Tax=Enteractinococcus fodinae TaxID=684663 RepID=A0ABU2B2G2_9MICC|nr:asparaginase [Enteractinococcus fodinae]MDR7347785.1 L-asparaginase [Enteractinococcus fodinae]